MRAAALAVLLLAGCVLPSTAPPETGSVVAASFDHDPAPWAVMLSSGCGLCGGDGGFGAWSEHFALFVFDDGHLLRIDWRGGPWGENATHAPDNVTYDRADLRGLVQASPRGAAGESWVVRTWTAKAKEDGLAASLRALWGPHVERGVCTDAGMSLSIRHANGTVETDAYSCGPEAPSMAALAQKLRQLDGDVVAHGTREGYAPYRDSPERRP